MGRWMSLSFEVFALHEIIPLAMTTAIAENFSRKTKNYDVDL